MIEKFNGIIYLIIFLVHFIGTGVYAFQLIIGTKKFHWCPLLISVEPKKEIAIPWAIVKEIQTKNGIKDVHNNGVVIFKNDWEAIPSPIPIVTGVRINTI